MKLGVSQHGAWAKLQNRIQLRLPTEASGPPGTPRMKNKQKTVTSALKDRGHLYAQNKLTSLTPSSSVQHRSTWSRRSLKVRSHQMLNDFLARPNPRKSQRTDACGCDRHYIFPGGATDYTLTATDYTLTDDTLTAPDYTLTATDDTLTDDTLTATDTAPSQTTPSQDYRLHPHSYRRHPHSYRLHPHRLQTTPSQLQTTCRK